MSNCKHCGQPLNVSVRNVVRALKSCPRCSSANGSYHVFHDHPSEFGTTPLRATDNTPDGAQSYCVPCRSGKTPKVGQECPNVLPALKRDEAI